MNITNETKIGELVPEGYEVAQLVTFREGFKITFKRKINKDFNWYVEQYIMDNELLNESHHNYHKRFKDKDFEAIPFELRMGLLKFICDDQRFKLSFVLSNIARYDKGDPLIEFCPKEFLESLFE